MPDWSFALGFGVAILALVYVPLWAPDAANFVEPQAVSETHLPETETVGQYLGLAEVRPDEEPPAASSVVVEAFGHDVSVDGSAFTWGASVRNTHGEYAATFGLQVSVEGVDLVSGEFVSAFSGMTPPGGEARVGGSFYLGDDFPSDPVVDIAVVELEWFASDGGTSPEALVSPLSARLDEIDEGDDPNGEMRFSVTITNSAAHAIRPVLTAAFHRADGTPVGAATLYLIEPVPSGDSTRELEVWKKDVPDGADLSMTEFVTIW